MLRMKYLSLVFMLYNTGLVIINAQIYGGNGQFVQERDNKMHKLLLKGSLLPALMEPKSMSERPIKEADIYNSRYSSWGRYSPLTIYKPSLLPISYYGKRHGDVLETTRSKYYVKNLKDDKIEFEKRSVSSAVVNGDLDEYETLLRTLNILQSEKDVDLLDIINRYDDGLQQVLELLVPPLSADKLESIGNLLNSMIKRRFGSWGGRKRSEFYSWGGRKKRDSRIDRPQSEENSLAYVTGSTDMRNDYPNKDEEPNMYDDSFSEQASPTTNKRNSDFYPWGGKRTLPPSFSG